MSAIKVPWKEPANDRPSPLEEAHGELVLTRLHALVQAGYRPKLGAEAGGASQINLEHPNAQPLTLWPDGQVVDMYPTNIKDDGERTIIHYDDREGFKAFIASVPRPNVFHRIWHTSLRDLFWQVFSLALVIGFIGVVGHFLGKLFH